MAREGVIEVEGSVEEPLPAQLYRVVLANGHRVLAHWRGRDRRNAIVLQPGDRVRLEMSLFDLSKGGIVWNEKEL